MVAGSGDARRKFTDMLTADAEVGKAWPASSAKHTTSAQVHRPMLM